LARHAPGPVPLVLAYRHDGGAEGAVRSRGDLPLERFLVGALEVAQALRTGHGDAGVAILLGDDVLLPLVLDRGELQLFAQEAGQLPEGAVPLQHVLARRVSCLAGPLGLAHADDGADVALPLSDAALLARLEDEAGELDLRQRDADQVLSLAPDQLAARD